MLLGSYNLGPHLLSVLIVTGVPNRVPVHSYVAYRCPVGWAFSANPNVEPYHKLVCQPDTGRFDGLDEEWPQCFDPNAAEGKIVNSGL